MHSSSLKNRHFVGSATHAKEAQQHNKSKDHFILFLIIKYREY